MRIGTLDAGSPHALPSPGYRSRGFSQQPKNNNKMRNYSKTVGALAAASTLVAGYASAEIEGEVTVSYNNIYEFRFVDLGDDLVTAAVDVGTSVGNWSFSAGAWYAVWDTDNATQAVANFLGGPPINNDELDLYGEVAYSFGDLTLAAGYIYYYFPDGGGNTQEVYASVGYDFAFGLSLASTYYYDFDAFSGWYWDNSLGYSWAINDCFSIDFTTGFAFADGQGLQLDSSSVAFNPGSTKDGYQGWYVGVDFPWEFREGVTISPYIKYADGASDLLTDLGGLNDGQDHVVAGVNFSVGF